MKLKLLKKSELKANSEIKTQESKVQSENKIVKKETRNYDLQKESNRIVITRKTIKMKILKMMEKLVKKANSDTNIDKIRGFFKEFIVSVRLDVKIVNVKKENNGKYLVVLDGKDMRFLIGERGRALNSLEYLISTTKKFKHLKISVDSNNYKEKREHSLRDLARKKGKAVLSTGNAIKLNPMASHERRIIHEEISFMKGLKTESVGEDPKRYLIIKKLDEKN